MFTLTIKNRSSPAANKASSSPFPLSIDIPDDEGPVTVADVKGAIHSRVKKLLPERQRITSEDKKALIDDSKSLADEGIKKGDTLYVKDLGPQVAWRTVFLTEYAGPLIIHPLIYYWAPTIYRRQFEHSQMQTLAFSLVMLHYAKREFETVFVHRFSNGTMPLFNIFKNSAHYWILSGALLAGAVYGPWIGAQAVKGTVQDDSTFMLACAGVWAVAELGNLYSHLQLSRLRPPGTRTRKIPRGFAFELVSCPNYFFEAVAWTSFTVLTLSPAAALFAAVSVGQMALWAIKKHKAYRREFPDYPRGRKIMFPFVF